MHTFHARARPSEDGVLHLDFTSGIEPRAEYDVVVVLRARDPENTNRATPTDGWAARLIAACAGSISDETFRRHDQGEAEVRLDF